MRSLKNNTKIAPVQEHFLSFVRRVAVELIREKEREETSKLWSCLVKGPLLLCIFSDTFTLCAKQLAAPRFHAWGTAQCLKSWEMCAAWEDGKTAPGCGLGWEGRESLCSAGSAQIFLLSSPSWCFEKLRCRLLNFTKLRKIRKVNAAIHEHGAFLLIPRPGVAGVFELQHV